MTNFVVPWPVACFAVLFIALDWGPGIAFGETGTPDQVAVHLSGGPHLFIDDYLIDNMTGAAERRLHHPTPREVVLQLDKPWEGKSSAYFAVVQHDERILIFYNAHPPRGSGLPKNVTCVIESTGGIHLRRHLCRATAREGDRLDIVPLRGELASAVFGN